LKINPYHINSIQAIT